MESVRDEVIGFAGLGLMGLPMAERIARARQPMAVWTRSAVKLKFQRQA